MPCCQGSERFEHSSPIIPQRINQRWDSNGIPPIYGRAFRRHRIPTSEARPMLSRRPEPTSGVVTGASRMDVSLSILTTAKLGSGEKNTEANCMVGSGWSSSGDTKWVMLMCRENPAGWRASTRVNRGRPVGWASICLVVNVLGTLMVSGMPVCRLGLPDVSYPNVPV